MKNLLVIILMILSAASGSGQNNFVKSYIITEKGDTIKGEAKVNPKKVAEAYDKIYFKDANGIQKAYKANKIIGYGVEDDHFISLDNDGEPKFYKVLTRGEINLYMIIFESMNMNEVSFEPQYYVARPDNKKLVAVKQSKFKKQMTEWMKDNTEFITSYEDAKTLDEEKAIAAISQYNTWKAGQ